MGKVDLVIAIKEARYLHETEWFTKQDPYAVFWTTSTAKNQLRTKVFKNGGTVAVWEETFTITADDGEAESFYMEVMNKNGIAADKLIGENFRQSETNIRNTCTSYITVGNSFYVFPPS